MEAGVHEQRQLFKKRKPSPEAVSRVEIRSRSPPLSYTAGAQARMSSTLTCHVPLCGQGLDSQLVHMPQGTWGSPGNWSAYKTSSVLEEMTYRVCWDGFKHFLSLPCDWREAGTGEREGWEC